MWGKISPETNTSLYITLFLDKDYLWDSDFVLDDFEVKQKSFRILLSREHYNTPSWKVSSRFKFQSEPY